MTATNSELVDVLAVSQAENEVTHAWQTQLLEVQRKAVHRIVLARASLACARRDGSAALITAARANLDHAVVEARRISALVYRELLEIRRVQLRTHSDWLQVLIAHRNVL